MGFDIGLALGAVSVVAIPIGFGIGVVAMASPSRGEFRFAKACFIVAAIAAIASFAWLTHGRLIGLIASRWRNQNRQRLSNPGA
jgi:hypothetical protein